MRTSQIIVGLTIAAAGIGIGTGVNATDSTVERAQASFTMRPVSPPPPPPVAELAVPDQRQHSTTCEGAVSCGILGGACELAGGTYTDWESSDHGHTHGICTWPWE
ncbi:MAG: hypothetical protein QNJ12_05490 [Ilumatobacter sp.]|uniref:hypothetical protein n=1 Tax=Ilumatobacter sp. TaxID=1967498 RepID=UPI002605FAEC|nr:hypothetical protein [Ilumatobacter sp.]MDJ0768223.1 hypothetical protein [Ilumatobacter sp.]